MNCSTIISELYGSNSLYRRILHRRMLLVLWKRANSDILWTDWQEMNSINIVITYLDKNTCPWIAICHVIYTHQKKVLHHLSSTSSGNFTYKCNRDPHKQHFSSFYCSWKPHIAWCTIIQIDFQKLWSRLKYTPVPLTPCSTSSCIDVCLYPSWHTIHKFIKALLAQIVPLLNGNSA